MLTHKARLNILMIECKHVWSPSWGSLVGQELEGW